MLLRASDFLSFVLAIASRISKSFDSLHSLNMKPVGLATYDCGELSSRFVLWALYPHYTPSLLSLVWYLKHQHDKYSQYGLLRT